MSSTRASSPQDPLVPPTLSGDGSMSMSADHAVILHHDMEFRLPSVCACCLAPATRESFTSVRTGQGMRRSFALPECAYCARRQTMSLIGGIAALVLSGGLGLYLGTVLFPLGAMRLVPMLVAIAIGCGLFYAYRRLTQREGHAPGCSPIARDEHDPHAGAGQAVVIHFANARFAQLWRELNPESVREVSR